MSTYALYEAKAQLTSIVREVETGPAVKLSRHGKPVAILMGIEQYKNIQNTGRNLSSALRSYQASMGECIIESVETNVDPFKNLRAKDTGRSVEL